MIIGRDLEFASFFAFRKQAETKRELRIRINVENSCSEPFAQHEQSSGRVEDLAACVGYDQKGRGNECPQKLALALAERPGLD